MRVADGAMREGLLYDLLGRFTDEDARERTVRSMQQRYHVDLVQAERVEATAADFLAHEEKKKIFIVAKTIINVFFDRVFIVLVVIFLFFND